MRENWKNWKEKKSDMEIEESAKADWNMKRQELENLSDKMVILQNNLAMCKIYDRFALVKIIPMIEVTYGIIKFPLKNNFPTYYKKMEIALDLAHQFKRDSNKWLNIQNNIISNEVIEFVKSIEYLYDCLNEAIYSMGLGISFNKQMSPKDKIEAALE